MSDSCDSGRDQLSGPTSGADLRKALGAGDPQRVLALIEAGADIRYKADHGYDALLDAVHGRDVACDPRLLELLALLVAHGVDLSGVSAYQESGLRVLSRLGRFDAVRVLLNAGADKSQLEWTPLMEAVALGTLADVQAALARGAALEERDWWSRTAWLIAVLAGDIAKATLLRERGADPYARGRCGRAPLFYAIQGHHPDVLRWLLEQGADIHESDDFGTPPLIAAVESDDLECVELLLDAGADVEVVANRTALSDAGSREAIMHLLDARVDAEAVTDGGQSREIIMRRLDEAVANRPAISCARSREVIMRLLDAGSDPADLSCGGQRLILGLPDPADFSIGGQRLFPAVQNDALAAVSPDDFRRAFTRSFGEGNPEKMSVPFWEAMIHCGVCAYEARKRFEKAHALVAGPVWCAQRFGQSLTLLPEGRAVQVGGEHEDSYDPDFCIYNDVFVHGRDGSVAIYGYPQSVFPPTDFHAATLIDDSIYVIGSLGYQGTRRSGDTPVYRLDVRTLRMNRLDARGEAPGWIYQHRAVAVSPHEIRIWAGMIVTGSDGGEPHEKNLGSFVLDVDRLLWRRESMPGPP